MPIYDYTCNGCGRRFEARVSSPRARPACPGCGGRRAARAMARIAVRATSKAAPTLPRGGGPACGCGAIERDCT